MRIHVTGNAGAGKTTFARRLGQELGLPVIHLDEIVWQSGWRRTPTEQLRGSLQSVAAPGSWIIEGVSGLIRGRADLVVFLDVPRHVCLLRCVRRNWRYLFRSRPELPAECPEIRVFFALLRIIWGFPDVVGARIRAEAAVSSKYVVVRHPSRPDEWLHEFLLPQAAQQAPGAALGALFKPLLLRRGDSNRHENCP